MKVIWGICWTNKLLKVENRSSNRQIAKNAVLLYIRMGIIMLVQLYTSRVVLMALGFTDYGLYNVIGGIVVLFSFINGAMTGSTERYILYELGKGDFESLKSVFRSSIQLHAIIAVIIVVLTEPVGLWLIFNEMQIPEGRLTTALIVFQLSIVSTVINVLCVPYNATIIAHERMNIFAYVSIVDVLVRLLIVYLLLLIEDGRLVAYAAMLLVAQLGLRLFYGYYCHRHFKETIYTHIINKPQLKEMISFSGWNLLGNIAAVLNTQGLNILLNIFFGPVVNAARGIAVAVQMNVNQFSGNFQTAIIPELTKSYAAGEYNKTLVLMHRACRFSFFLLFIVVLPILFEADGILEVWLKDVPADSPLFVRILLLCLLIWAVTGPLTTVAYASGDIKRLNTVCSIIVLTALPISWLVLKAGAPAYSVFLVVLVVEIFSFAARLLILRGIIHYSIRSFINDVLQRIIIVALFSFVVTLIPFVYIPSGILRMLVVCVVAVGTAIFSSLFLGMSKGEREFIYNIVVSRIKRR